MKTNITILGNKIEEPNTEEIVCYIVRTLYFITRQE